MAPAVLAADTTHQPKHVARGGGGGGGGSSAMNIISTTRALLYVPGPRVARVEFPWGRCVCEQWSSSGESGAGSRLDASSRQMRLICAPIMACIDRQQTPHGPALPGSGYIGRPTHPFLWRCSLELSPNNFTRAFWTGISERNGLCIVLAWSTRTLPSPLIMILQKVEGGTGDF